MGFRQLVQKFERITPIISILQDKQNGWLFYGFSSTDSNVRRNTTNHLYSLTLFRLGGGGWRHPDLNPLLLTNDCVYSVPTSWLFLKFTWEQFGVVRFW